MPERRATIQIDIDFVRKSKYAHATTVQQIANNLGREAIEAFESYGYEVRAAKAQTMLHYVRHSLSTVLRRPKKRTIKHLTKVG